MRIKTEFDIPVYETRGRPPSDVHVWLLTKPIGASFFSTKRREALYQMARSVGVKVRVLKADEDGIEGYRMWKLALPDVAKAAFRAAQKREWDQRNAKRRRAKARAKKTANRSQAEASQTR